MQCLAGLKHVLSSVISCCDSENCNLHRVLENPEALARETVCMSLDFQCVNNLLQHCEIVSGWHLITNPHFTLRISPQMHLHSPLR